MRVPSRVLARRPALAAVLGVLALASASPAAADSLPAPPPAPENLAVTPVGFTEASTATATWTVPAGTPDGTTARWTACRTILDAGHPCEEGVSDTPGTAQIPTTGEGHYRVRVRLVSSGVEGPEVEVRGPDVDRTAPSAPQSVQLLGDRLTWTSASEDVAPVTRAHWRLCRGYTSGAVARACVTGVTDVATVPDPRVRPSIPFSAGTAALPPSPVYCDGLSTEVAVWLEDAAGHVDERNAGGLPHGGQPVVPAALPEPPAGRARRDHDAPHGGRSGPRRRGAPGPSTGHGDRGARPA